MAARALRRLSQALPAAVQKLFDLQVQIFGHAAPPVKRQFYPEMKTPVSAGVFFLPPLSFSGPGFSGFRFCKLYPDLGFPLFEERDHDIIQAVVRKRKVSQFQAGLIFQIQSVILQPGGTENSAGFRDRRKRSQFQHSRKIKDRISAFIARFPAGKLTQKRGPVDKLLSQKIDQLCKYLGALPAIGERGGVSLGIRLMVEFVQQFISAPGYTEQK